MEKVISLGIGRDFTMFKNQVASIMVTYNPDADVIENARSIVQSCLHLIIIDNGSNVSSQAYLHDLEKERNITVILNKSNVGLGCALNQGIELLLKMDELQHINWIATFDQDSKVENNYFEQMIQVYNEFLHKEEVAILAPNWIEQKLDAVNLVPQDQADNLLQEQQTVITSGSLIKKSILKDIGTFEEDYFIDFLDHEFCLRARSHGYKIYMVPHVIMHHNLGNTKEHQLFRFKVKATNHNYIRRYYITRNRLYTYKKYFQSEYEWVKQDFIATSKEFIIILLFEEDRLRKLGSMVRGIFDAIRGKKGHIK